VTASASIDQQHNRVAVAYTKVDIDTGFEDRDTTDWEDDDDSQTDYGIKELLWTCSAATDTHALAARSAKLGQDNWPTTYIQPAYDASQSSAELICRGWWDTLAWRYYKQTSGREAHEVSLSTINVGDASERILAQSFSLSNDNTWEVANIILRCQKIGAPTDGLRVKLAAWL
jgi:hypothetical protein